MKNVFYKINLLFLILIANSFYLEATDHISVTDPPIKGIKCLYWGAAMDANYRARIDSVLDLEYITGISIYIPWNAFEPSEGDYRWHYFDIPLEEAKRHEKTVSFGLTMAAQSPGWVKQKARTFTFTHIHPAVGEQTAPVPWDPTYMESISHTIHSIGEKYNGDKYIYFVMINGPSTLFGVETNWPLKYSSLTPDQKENMDFSLEKFEQGWKDYIDLFLEAFPDTRLALGLHHSLSIPEYSDEEKITACKAIRDYAIQKYRQRHPMDKMVLRLLGLCHDNPKYFEGEYSGSASVNDYISMVWDRKDDVFISYETTRIWSRSNLAGPINDPVSFDYFLHVIRNGISYAATSIEMKIPDIWNDKTNSPYEPYVDALIYGNYGLMKR